MKIKNLAFFGVMASILSVAGAYADDNTIIASKAYVDAKDSALNSTLQSATAAIGTNAEADNVLASSGTTKLTKVSAVQAAKSTTATATNSNGTITVQTGDDTHFPTTKAVGSGLTALKTKIDANTTAIGTKQATLADGTNMSVTGSGNAITSISATNGVVTATKGLTFLQAADISGKEDKSNKQGTGKGLITADTDKSIKTIAAGTAGYYQDQQALSEDFSKIKEAIALKANTSALGALASKDTVATADIDASAVTTAKIADSNVTTAKIANLNVTTDKLAAGAVTNGKLATDAVQTTNIKDGNVTTAKIADDAVTTAKIADANVTMAKTDFVVKQGTSTAAWNSASSSSSNTDEKALANAATSANADKYIPTVGAVESRVNAAVSSGINSIAEVTKNATTNQVVTGVTTKAGSVTSVTSSQVTTDMLASKAVTAGKIADNTITASQIANGTITNTQIADTTITGGKLVNGTITATQLAANAVETAEIKDGAVTIGKVASGAKSTEIPATGASNDKLATEKAVADAVAGAKSDATTAISALNVSTITTAGQPIVSVGETAGKVTAASGTITYKAGLNSTLKQIDSATTNATCSVSSPCILTYTGTDYKWTNMDTAGDSAVADSNS